MIRWPIATGIFFVSFLSSLPAADDLARSTWQIPTHEQVQVQIADWIAEMDLDQATADEIQRMWADPVEPDQRLMLLSRCIELLGNEFAPLMHSVQTSRFANALPDITFLETVRSEFLKHHVKLIYARWLVQNQLYNETLEQLDYTDTEDVVDPASLLFYQAIANHRLLQKDDCLPVVNRLLEKEGELPRRYTVLAQMMRDDIKPLEPDSLDEISRLMDNVKIRLGHGRAGKRVRTEEDDVIAKLDKMIKELEDQAQQQSPSSSSSGGQQGNNLNPAQPMEDSVPAGGRGPGNVDAKDIGDEEGWGNLPPKERQQALQQLGKDFPSHYRDVIEEYFRKLAKEGSDVGPR